MNHIFRTDDDDDDENDDTEEVVLVLVLLLEECNSTSAHKIVFHMIISGRYVVSFSTKLDITSIGVVVVVFVVVVEVVVFVVRLVVEEEEEYHDVDDDVDCLLLCLLRLGGRCSFRFRFRLLGLVGFLHGSYSFRIFL